MYYLHVNRQKLLIIIAFTWFLIFDKIQVGGRDGDHVWWRHRPPAEIHDYPTKHSFQVIEPSQTNEDTELPHHVLNTNEAAMTPPFLVENIWKYLSKNIVEQHADDLKNTKEPLCEWCPVSLR